MHFGQALQVLSAQHLVHQVVLAGIGVQQMHHRLPQLFQMFLLLTSAIIFWMLMRIFFFSFMFVSSLDSILIVAGAAITEGMGHGPVAQQHTEQICGKQPVMYGFRRWSQGSDEHGLQVIHGGAEHQAGSGAPAVNGGIYGDQQHQGASLIYDRRIGMVRFWGIFINPCHWSPGRHQRQVSQVVRVGGTREYHKF
jgi:hypothetical protein